MTPATLSLSDPDPETVVCGTFDLIDGRPTGTPEQVPAVVASGERPGPTLWVTGTVYGDVVEMLSTGGRCGRAGRPARRDP